MTTSTPFGGLSTVPINDTDDHYELVQRWGRPMATEVSVQIAAPSSRWAEAAAAADACMDWFDEVDARLSRFRPESELSHLNATAGDWFAASDVLYECAALALESAESSGGLFDPTMLRQLCALGYDRDFAAIAHREAQSQPALCSGLPLSCEERGTGGEVRLATAERAAWRAIALDPRRRRIRFPVGVQLDFGGIAKGWAADVALVRYCAAFPGALVNVGGDLRAHGGPQPGELWTVGIRDPRLELSGIDDPATHLATARLSRGAMATSGAVRRWWLRDGQRQHHLLDPRTGQPIPLWTAGGDEPDSLIATATAFAPTAAQAEVAAKVALLRGYPAALAAVESAWKRYGALGPRDDGDAGVALALVFGSGEIVFSRNLKEYLATWGTQGAMLPLMVGSALPPLTLAEMRQLEQRS
ncbi:MAG TPA: FAD:protein FMN transferase [Ktedonobacterales bacterium]|nr:FAD:protein FMN transferase [Ktedonobacterales bacterium]